MTRTETRTLPLWPKIAWTAVTALIVAVYWREYGPSNFLWFSDIALLAICLALWVESALIVSMMAVGVLALEILWNIDLLAGGPFGLAAYMYDDTYPLWLRALSLFHVAMPPALIWLLWRLGYDRRAPVGQTVLALVVLPASLAVSTREQNINWVYGLGAAPQDALPPLVYFACLMIGFPLLVYLPTHLVLSRLFRRP